MSHRSEEDYSCGAASCDDPACSTHGSRRGRDVYRGIAALILGIPETQVTEDQRREARALSIGFRYGRSNYGGKSGSTVWKRASVGRLSSFSPNVEPKPLFYIQNSGYCGNCLKWWRVDGHGYTLDLREAWKVTEEKARDICRSRPREDVAWPVSLIDGIAALHVNAEALREAVEHETEKERKS